jgi:hypothetical protein
LEGSGVEGTRPGCFKVFLETAQDFFLKKGGFHTFPGQDLREALGFPHFLVSAKAISHSIVCKARR